MLYEFKCYNCEHIVSHISKVDDRNKPLKEPCPECNSIDTLKRVYTPTVQGDPEILKADRRMEDSGVQRQLERIRDQCNPDMKWKG